jgi:hypothetical protein
MAPRDVGPDFASAFGELRTYGGVAARQVWTVHDPYLPFATPGFSQRTLVVGPHSADRISP